MKPPAFQFYAKDWLSSTLGMPWDVAGVYIHLLAWSWDNGPLPDDAKWRLRSIGQAHARLWKAVRSRWVHTPTGWINPRLEQQRELQASFQKRAQKGANARWQASPKHMQKRWSASASASASADSKPAAAPPVSAPPFKVYNAIATRVLAETADLDLDVGTLVEEIKRACAKQAVPYDATIVHKAMDAAQTARSSEARMTRSESINELAAALAAAQGDMLPAKRDAENQHFRHRYADLAAIWDACRWALTSHGLAVVQSPRLVSIGESLWMVEVETTLFHSSGQSLSDVLAVPVAPSTAQVVGSAITYARRYSLAAFVGVAPAGDDDDATAASEAPVRQIKTPPPAPPPVVDPLPAGAMETVTGVKVIGVVKRILPSGREKYVISGMNGAELTAYGTLSMELATDAKRAKENGTSVDITFKPTRYGLDIVDLREVVPEPPL